MTHEDTVDYAALLGIAHATVYEISSPSSRANLTEAVAAHAVEQYFEAVDGGAQIRSPEAWVATAARRRAVEALLKWTREKKRHQRLDIDDWETELYMDDATKHLVRYIDESGDEYDGIHTALWVGELIESTFPDPVNREIAARCLVDGEKPGIVAEDLGLEAPVVSNRLSRIRTKLKSEISIDDLRD